MLLSTRDSVVHKSLAEEYLVMAKNKGVSLYGINPNAFILDAWKIEVFNTLEIQHVSENAPNVREYSKFEDLMPALLSPDILYERYLQLKKFVKRYPDFIKKYPEILTELEAPINHLYDEAIKKIQIYEDFDQLKSRIQKGPRPIPFYLAKLILEALDASKGNYKDLEKIRIFLSQELFVWVNSKNYNFNFKLPSVPLQTENSTDWSRRLRQSLLSNIEKSPISIFKFS